MNVLSLPAAISIIAASICALIIALDLVAHKQRMWIMNVVLPITALYSGPLGLWAYYRLGRSNTKHREHDHKKAFWQSTAVATTHCGAGCTLGDLAAEWFVVAIPVRLFGSILIGARTLDFAAAYLFGIVFQYFTIAPMRGLKPGAGIVAAIKADTFSLLAWQLGMYGWMTIVRFVLLGDIPKTSPVFWFMMQIAMLAGFLTSYPVNWLLLKSGLKEIM